MSEVRIDVSYEYPPDMPPELKTPDNATITTTERVVSDEELLQEELAKEANDGHLGVIEAYSEWATMSDGEKLNTIRKIMPTIMAAYLTLAKRRGLIP